MKVTGRTNLQIDMDIAMNTNMYGWAWTWTPGMDMDTDIDTPMRNYIQQNNRYTLLSMGFLA
jgi:hypothetical protein